MNLKVGRRHKPTTNERSCHTSSLPAHRTLTYFLDNLADIATLLVALCIVIRHRVHPFDLATLISWMIAVLALLAISGIWDRSRRLARLETLASDTGDIVRSHLAEPPRAARFFSRNIDPKELEDAFASANHIFICGLTLTRTTRQFMDAFSKRLEAGADVRLAFLDPTNKGLMEIMAARSMGSTTADYWTTRINTVVQVIQVTSQPKTRGALRVGFAPFPPSFGLTLIDPDQPHAKCYVELYHHKTAERNPTFCVTRADDPFWYTFFRSQWNELWSSCRVQDDATPALGLPPSREAESA